MSQYTMTLKELINSDFNLWNFDFDMKPEEHKPYFKELFERHFQFREIGFETPGRFRYHLQTELMKLLPYYNKLYMSQALEQRILDNYDVTETFDRTTSNNSKVDENVRGSATNNNVTLNQYSDTPIKRVNINDNDFISSLSKDQINGNQNVTNNFDREGINSGTEKWVRTMKGNIGVQTDADAVIKYESSLKNVDMLLLGELENLFMGVY